MNHLILPQKPDWASSLYESYLTWMFLKYLMKVWIQNLFLCEVTTPERNSFFEMYNLHEWKNLEKKYFNDFRTYSLYSNIFFSEIWLTSKQSHKVRK